MHVSGSQCYVCSGPQVQPCGSVPKTVGDDITKATGNWKVLRITVKMTIQERKSQIELVVSSASAVMIKPLKEPQEATRSKKKPQTNKQKKTHH